MITFEVEMGKADLTSQVTPRFLISKADWSLFDNVLQENFQPGALDPTVLTNGHTLCGAVLDLERGIMDACNVAIPKKKYFSKSVPWWTPELTLLRKDVNKCRKRYQKCRNGIEKSRLREAYREVRRNYQACLFKTKQTSWRDFVTRTSENNPWSLIYKMQTDKVRVEKALNTISHGESSTEGGILEYCYYKNYFLMMIVWTMSGREISGYLHKSLLPLKTIHLSRMPKFFRQRRELKK